MRAISTIVSLALLLTASPSHAEKISTRAVLEGCRQVARGEVDPNDHIIETVVCLSAINTLMTVNVADAVNGLPTTFCVATETAADIAKKFVEMVDGLGDGPIQDEDFYTYLYISTITGFPCKTK